MRRCVILAVLGASVLAGCGSGSSSSSNPVNTELSYLPSGSPYVLTIETDSNGSAIKGVNALVGRFGFASLGVAALKSKLQQSGINYDADLRPLFGNPLAIAITTPKLGGVSTTSAVIVWVTKDAGKLKSLITKAVPGARTAGSRDGATLYRANGSGAFAVDGATLIAASSQALVNAALDRHAHGGGITAEQYSHALAGLPENALVKVWGDLSSVLSQPSVASARRIPWVAALKGYSATITASSAGLSFDYHLDTTGAPLTTSQLPFAAGSTAPGFAGAMPITFSIHDPAQIATFIEAAEQTSSPSSYAAFLKREAAVRAKTGIDLNSLIKLLTGDLIISSDTKTTLGRVTVNDPAAAAATLSQAGERTERAVQVHLTRHQGGPLLRDQAAVRLEAADRTRWQSARRRQGHAGATPVIRNGTCVACVRRQGSRRFPDRPRVARAARAAQRQPVVADRSDAADLAQRFHGLGVREPERDHRRRDDRRQIDDRRSNVTGGRGPSARGVRARRALTAARSDCRTSAIARMTGTRPGTCIRRSVGERRKRAARTGRTLGG